MLLRAATLVGMLAVARAVCALGRENYVPPIFAVVSGKHGTPVFATAILGSGTGTPIQLSTLKPKPTCFHCRTSSATQSTVAVLAALSSEAQHTGQLLALEAQSACIRAHG